MDHKCLECDWHIDGRCHLGPPDLVREELGVNPAKWDYPPVDPDQVACGQFDQHTQRLD